MFSLVNIKIFVSIYLFEAVFVICQSVTPTQFSICGEETELELEGSGVNSSVILTLDRYSAMTGNTCKLRISAPETHIIYIHVIEDDVEDIVSKDENSSSQEEDNTCLLSVYVPENHRAAVWRSNPCTANRIHEGPLVPHQARIVWNIDNNPRPKHGRKIVLTALTQKEDCRQSGKHVCLKVGWTPFYCISEDLVCDGIPNCPAGGNSDEDAQLCKDKKSKTSWEKLANDFLKKFAGKNHGTHDFIPTTSNYDSVWLKDTFFRVTTERSDKRYRKESDTLAGLLARYGPWGYLMLGMLICGTALMVCGLWECCCRKAKSTSNRSESSRPASSSPQSTTVLIINPHPGTTDQSEEVNQLPPNYEDLDQPPSYSTLFPTNK